MIANHDHLKHGKVNALLAASILLVLYNSLPGSLLLVLVL